MADMKRLAKETAIYGMSSIVGRFLNWGLSPFYTYVLGTPADFGMVGELYAWTAILLVLLTYGMETGFFRYANKSDVQPQVAYTSIMSILLLTSSLFVLILSLFLPSIAGFLGYAEHKEFVWIMGAIVALDAFTALPFAWLRFEKRPLKFAYLKLGMIFVNIFFNLFFLWICPKIYSQHPQWIDWFYRPDFGVGYVFVANGLSSVAVLLALLPQIIQKVWKIDFRLIKSVLHYSIPLMWLGLAGIMNQSLDKVLLKHLYGSAEAGMHQLGIYTACFKIGVVMMMFTQAFRYAYEPFVFSKQKEVDHTKTYAQAMHFYVIFSVFVFLGVMYYLDLLQYLIRADYREGLIIVPVVLLCYIFQGITFNLSFWYKLTDRTQWGAYISILGLVVTVLGNLIFVPMYGYIASAWTSFLCFLGMMLVSWWLGRTYYPIPYNLILLGRYVLVGALLYMAGMWMPIDSVVLRMLYRSFLLLLFLLYVWRREFPDLKWKRSTGSVHL